MSIKGKILKEMQKHPRSLKELKARLGNDKKVARAVDELLKSKKITQCGNVYATVNDTQSDNNTIKCTIVKLGKSFGFAKPAQEGKDVFIPGRFLRGAMPGDEVMVRITGHSAEKGTQEGEVEFVTAEHNEFVGTIDIRDGRLVLLPDGAEYTPIPIKKAADGGASKGEKAAIVILERGDDYREHRAGVSMCFGSSAKARHCAKAVLYAAGIEKQFPTVVKAQAKNYEDDNINGKDIIGRKDLRDEAVFTVDGADTKDIDDAISIIRTDKGYTLGVHIADVSHYVQPQSPLDKEAFARGTSVYYADNVIPMLPRQLSNGICSLNPGVDRLSFSCIMQLDLNGRVKDFTFVKSVIRSRVKGVYSEINAIIDGTANDATIKKYSGVSDEIALLHELYQKLAAVRSARGAMDIESKEAKLIINDDGVCIGAERRERGEAEKMIEEFMLLANTSSASLARRLKLPFLYRIHEYPQQDRIDDLKKLLTACAVNAKFESELPSVKELSMLLDATRGTPIETAIHTAILRSMAKAKYSVQPLGHFGLALDDYAHFTSPIRRYPDLAIHRILTDVAAGIDEKQITQKYQEFAIEAAEQSSARELIAMQVERNAEDCYKAEYMKPFVGKEFDALISGVTNFGIYVQLPNTIEGLIRVHDFVRGDAVLCEGVSLSDSLTGKVWRLGDKVRVKLTAADIAKGQMDFAFC